MKERDVLLQGREDGQETMDYPITRLSNIDGRADIKVTPAEGDYIPIMDGADGGQMKKMPVGAVCGVTRDEMNTAISEAIAGAIEEAY